jgi:hypothetical protein
MNRALKIALVSASLLFCGVTAGTLAAAADEPTRAPAARPAAARPAPAARANAARPTFDGRGQVLDSRYNHVRYYPPAGTARATLPEGYRPYFHGGNRYYFSGGVWYAPRGAGFVVIAPPVGLVVGVLPPYYSTVWFGGVPYYYADNVYYTWQPDQNGYAVANPPSDPDAPPDAPSPPPDQQPPPDSGVQNDLIATTGRRGRPASIPRSREAEAQSRAIRTWLAATTTARCPRVCRAGATRSTSSHPNRSGEVLTRAGCRGSAP